jgi:methyl-accepting chemotaxis protein
LFRNRLHLWLWTLTSSLVIALTLSLLSAAYQGNRLLLVIAVCFLGMSLLLWLLSPVRRSLSYWWLGENLRRAFHADRTDITPEQLCSEVVREIEEGRSRLNDLALKCYTAAAAMSYIRSQTGEVEKGVVGTIEQVRHLCIRLKRDLVDLQQALAQAEDDPDHHLPAAQNRQDIVQSPDTKLSGIEPLLREIISSAGEMTQTLRDVDHNAKELLTSTEETAYSMSRLDSFLQDMAARGRELESSTETANRVALEGTKVVEEMEKENEAIITAVKGAAASVEDLGRWSQEVGKIVEVIRDIANETNLLALNAAIIAAQSGEHGKAFGVVAEEIRGLAERTTSSTKEISDLVKTVQKNVANVVQGMKRSLQRVERGELLARNAGRVLERVFESFESSRSMAKQIAASTFEHKMDSSHVVRSIHKVSDIAGRLESQKFGKWSETCETLAAAKMLRTVSGAAITEGTNSQVNHVEVLTAEVHRAPKAVRSLLEQAVEGERELRESLSILESVSEKLASCLAAIDEATRRGIAVAREIHVDDDRGTVKPCWEIAKCSEEVRRSCPAYRSGDWRCFLVDDVACVMHSDDRVHRQRRCYDCVVFRTNLESLSANRSDSEK